MMNPTFAALMGSLLLSALPSTVSAYLRSPNEAGINAMCLPIYSDLDRVAELGLTQDNILSSLANSPFPCEQVLYMQHGCAANGTTPIDFLAEQQCLCNGAFFDVSEGCFLCKQYHGYNETSLDDFQSSQSSISVAECASAPTQAYTDVLPPAPITNSEVPYNPSDTVSTTGPTQTNVDKYWTPTAPVALGEITGSATARQTVSTTTTADAVSTPTTTNAAAGIAAAPGAGLLAVALGAVLAL